MDFHWEVNGKEFEFSIPGGGCVTLTEMVKRLGMVDQAAVGEDGDEIELASDDAQAAAFVADVANLVFSAPELLSVSKVEESTTVGAIKERLELACENSAELTEEDLAEIDAMEIEPIDWALISVKPFDTDETLTITMKDGAVFTIRVTDANFASAVDGKTFALIIANSAKTSGYALDTTVRSDRRLTSRTTNINYLSETVNEEVYFCDDVSTIKWTFEYIKGTGNQFKLKASNGQYLHWDGNGFSLSNDPTILYADVTPGDNDHVRLCIDPELKQAINLFGGNNGFSIYDRGNNDPNELFTLCMPFNMNSNTPGTITTVDNNAEGIELKLFDYDKIGTAGTTGDLDKEGNWVGGHDNSSVNTNKKLWFLGWGSNSNTTTPGINDFTGLDDKISVLQGVVQNNLSGGYPVLAVDQDGNATNESLDYLFNGSANDTATYTANHLFEKIGDKYSYDSNKHYAEFNKTTGNFTVYNGTLEQNKGSGDNWAKNDKPVGFFPFDKYSDMKGLYDSNRLYVNPNVSTNDQPYRMNHHNGMSLTTHFRLPEGGKDSYGNDIEFDFSGDDDLWVYIDDVLVLDMGGVHQPINGSINFTSGVVTVDKAVAAKGASATAGASTTIEEMFRLAGKEYDPNKLHEMKVFWLERGGCDSNYKIEFNLPLTTTKEAGNITFDKVSAVNESLKLQGAVFTLFTDAACTIPYTIGNVPVTATSDKNGRVDFYAIPVGQYYVKETTFPEGYQAKNPEEIFSVNVQKDVTVKPMLNGDPMDPVTNEPKKIEVEVEKLWENGPAPEGASIKVTLGRYKLVEDPNAQGEGTLIIRDSYTNLPSGEKYTVTYRVTGGGVEKVIGKTFSDPSKSDIEISVPDLPAGVAYTVTKTVTGISRYDTTNATASQTVTVPKNGTATATLPQSSFSRNSYRVRVYAVNNKNWNTLHEYSSEYYPAGSALKIAIKASSGNEWIWNWVGHTKQYTVHARTSGATSDYGSRTFNQDGEYQFTNWLNQDIDLYIVCDNDGEWTGSYDWLVTPQIQGASPVSIKSLGSRSLMLAKNAAPTLTKSGIQVTPTAPTLPAAPKDTLYVLDDFSEVITLNSDPWKGKTGELDAYNDYGPYVYFISEIEESGMPDGTQVTIANEVTLDGSVQILTVTNRLPDRYPIEVYKKDAKTGQALAGAKFYLKKDDGRMMSLNVAAKNGGAIALDDGCFVVPEEGVVISDLYAGTYTLVEVEAPAGYNLPSTGWTFTLNADGTVTGPSGIAVGNALTIPNTPGVALPSTGGPGTGAYRALGAMLALAALALLLRKRRTAE